MLNSQLIGGVMIDWDKIDRDSYLRNIDAISHVDHIAFTHSVTYFVGENGSGKSTLLEAIAIACGFNPEGGTRNYNFSTYDSHSELCDAIRLSRGVRRAGYGYFLRAESFYNVATKEEEYSREPGAEILSFDDGPTHPCTYEETDSYQVTSMFINNREQILHSLLDE